MIHLIGIGPGDPELLTVKAARLLGEADVIYVPQSREDGRSVAKDIIAPYGGIDKIQMVLVPMRQDRGLALDQYRNLALQIARKDKEGLKQVFVTLGDPMVYSTAQYLAQELGALQVEYAYVSGIPSFIAAANHAGVSLGAGRQAFVVATMPENPEKLFELASQYETVVVMKINKKMPVLVEYVQKHSPKTAVLVHRLGMPDEQVFTLGASTFPEGVGYLSTAIIRQNF